MSYIEFIITSLTFLSVIVLSVLLLNSRIQNIINTIRITSLRDIAFSKIDELIHNNKETQREYFIFVFRIHPGNFSGEQTVLINLSVDCDFKLNVSSIRVYGSGRFLPFRINSFEGCIDGSLKTINVSVYFFELSKEEILKIYLSSGFYEEYYYYDFQENYKGAISVFLGMGKVRSVNLEKLVSFGDEMCRKNKNLAITLIHGRFTMLSCNSDIYKDALISFEIPINILLLEKAKMKLGIYN